MKKLLVLLIIVSSVYTLKAQTTELKTGTVKSTRTVNGGGILIPQVNYGTPQGGGIIIPQVDTHGRSVGGGGIIIPQVDTTWPSVMVYTIVETVSGKEFETIPSNGIFSVGQTLQFIPLSDSTAEIK